MKTLSHRILFSLSSSLYGVQRRAINGWRAVFIFACAVMSPVSANAETVLLALGDSLTAGYGLSQQDSFTTRLQAALNAEGRDVRVINGGVSGDTSKGGLERVDWMFADKPDVMLVELGANDGLRGLPPEQTGRNIAAIIEKAQAAGVTVLLTGMKAPPNLGREYGQEFDALYPDLAEKYDVIFYPFFLDGVAADASLNQSDGMHPNAVGVEVIVERILPSVLQALDSVNAS